MSLIPDRSSTMNQRFFTVGLIVAAFYSSKTTATSYNSYILHPVSGDTVYAGQIYNVTWFVDPSFSTLNLCIFNVNWYIARDIPNSGSYIWNVEPIWSSGSAYWMILNRIDW